MQLDKENICTVQRLCSLMYNVNIVTFKIYSNTPIELVLPVIFSAC